MNIGEVATLYQSIEQASGQVEVHDNATLSQALSYSDRCTYVLSPTSPSYILANGKDIAKDAPFAILKNMRRLGRLHEDIPSSKYQTSFPCKEVEGVQRLLVARKSTIIDVPEIVGQRPKFVVI